MIPHLALSLGSPNCHLGDMARGRLIREDGEIVVKFFATHEDADGLISALEPGQAQVFPSCPGRFC